MLDFKELGGSGRGLEQLVREVLLLMDLDPYWSGVGPDGGRDLMFNEPGLALLGRKRRRWLVSCKDFAVSGRGIGVDDVVQIVDVVQQHSAQGFLLVCTTHPSSALVERLRAIQVNSSGSLATHIWDGVTLERLLASPRSWAVAQRFMPVSTDAAGWKIFGTEAPNRWVAVHRGYYFHLSNRDKGGPYFDLQSLDRRIDELEEQQSDGLHFRLRGIWFDDAKGGGYEWYIDWMVPIDEDLPDRGEIEAIERRLYRGVREDGQDHRFEIEARHIMGSDHFDIDHYHFYKRLSPYV
jgi:hypothetical protein